MAKPFENTGKKISFEEIVKLIETNCEYKFAIIDNEVFNKRPEQLSVKEFIDLTNLIGTSASCDAQ